MQPCRKRHCHLFFETGRGVRIWVRAQDVMGHTKVNSTFVSVDTTRPVVSDTNSSDTKLQVNYKGGKYNYTTR